MAPTLKNIRFGRRKSQGNSFEEGSPTAPTSSFRVIPREDATRKSTSNALDLRKAATFQPTGQSSYEYDSGSSNRGSNSSASTAARSQNLFDPSTTRFSSTSTLQSPVEAMKKDRAPSPHFLKLGDDFESDFGDIFSGVDKRKSGLMDDSHARPLTLGRVESEPILSNPPKAFSSTQRVTSPSPTLLPLRNAQRRKKTASPPTQWARRNSRDRLISSPDLDSPVDDEPPPPPPKHTAPGKGPQPYAYGLLSEPSDMLEEPPRLGHTASLRSQHSFTRSGADEDADAAFVRRSVHAMRSSTLQSSGAFESSPLARKEMKMSNALAPLTSQPLNSSSDISLKTTSSTSSAAHEQNSSSTPRSQGVSPSESTRSTPRVAPAEPAKEEVGTFDPEVMQAIHQANNRSMLGLPTDSPTSSPARPSGSRVMSVAEFNKQKANTWHTAPKKPADDDSDDGYEDDDDDPQIQAQKRRLEAQKEAQHAVWRQKMKKAIGDQSTLPLASMRPDFARANHSAPMLTFNGKPQQDEEDDDVPLAILQAHNFPGKNKTPDPRMSQQSYTGVQDRSSSPGRTSGAGQRASQLPVFARRLPEDPYFGASDLSAPSNRDSLAFNKARAQSVYGSTSGPPPGGLVGVIAEEERERRARRGSPNAQAGMGFNMPGMGPIGAGMPMQVPMGLGSPMGQQDTIRNQQMLELMQQNSFMMKEMMEMRAQMQMFQMGGGPMPQGIPMPGLPSQGRPMSIADQNPRRGSVAPGSMYGRTMSFMGPAPNMFMNQQVTPGATGGARSVRNMPVGNFGPLNGYTPSIAPSERSNIGQPSRYKPVNLGDGGSTVTAGSTPRLSQMPTTEKKKSGFLSAVVHQGRKSMSRSKDDDDEEEWVTVRRRR